MKKALLIGINYTNTDSALSGCINDIYNIRDYLLQSAGYLQDNITILSDKDISPTRNAIETYISWLVSGNNPEDVLFFHFSGHGSFIRDTSSDETDRRDEVLVPIDYRTRGFISDDWLFTNLVCAVQPGVTLWAFIDACHSGSVLDLRHNFFSLCSPKESKLPSSYDPKKWTEKYLYRPEKSREVSSTVAMFSGALDPEYAEDAYINNTTQGAFTFCMLECLKSNVGKELKLRNILKEVNCRLDMAGYKQNTQLSVSLKTDLEKIFRI